MKNPRLWLYEFNREYVEWLTALLDYEKNVCAYCPRKFCEDVDDLKECYNRYEEKKDGIEYKAV